MVIRKTTSSYKKIIIGVILVVISLVLIGNIYSSKKKPSPEKQTASSNWQTYESSLTAISFKYPNDWELSFITEEADIFRADLHKEDKEQGKIEVYTEEIYPSYSINISKEDNEEYLTAKEHYLNMFGKNSRQKAESELQEAEYGGLPGIKYPEAVAPSSGRGYGVLLFDKKTGSLYRFVYSALATKETHEKYLPIFEQFLNTFTP